MFTVVGCHAGGEIGNVVVGGVLPPPGETVFEQMQALRADDSLRRLLLREPRGSVAVHANLVVPSPPTALRDTSSWSRPSTRPCPGRTRSASRRSCSRRGWSRCASRRRLSASRRPPVRSRFARQVQRRVESVELTNVPCSPSGSTRRSRSTGSARWRSTSPTEGCGTRSPTRPRSGSRSNRRRRRNSPAPGRRSARRRGSRFRACIRRTPTSQASASSQIAEPWQGVGGSRGTRSWSHQGGSTARRRAPGSAPGWPPSTRAGLLNGVTR